MVLRPPNSKQPTPARGQELTWQMEDYLETIAHILERDQVARASEIASQLKVTRASVTSALRGLAAKGLVNYQPYSQVTLTTAGQKLAAGIIARHRTLSAFLQDVLQMPRHLAEANACRAEHVLGSEVMERIDRFMEFIHECPRTSQIWQGAFQRFCQRDPQQSDCKECVGRCLADLYQDPER